MVVACVKFHSFILKSVELRILSHKLSKMVTNPSDNAHKPFVLSHLERVLVNKVPDECTVV